MAAFDIDEFWEFCACLKIDTKNLGEISLTQENITGTQRYFIEEVAKAINDDIHTIIVLKGRQVMITTICLALDLFWVGKYSGMSGSLVTHDEETRNMMQNTLGMYHDGLPNKFKAKKIKHNRYEFLFGNRSRLSYQVAGTQKKRTKLGKGKGLTFGHMTEASVYGDPDGIASLKASFAQDHPNRLFIWESTAAGYNNYYDMWQTAKDSVAQAAIFVGWWRNQYYRIKRGTAIHDVYWDGLLLPEEQAWIDEVKALYDYDIDDEQIAWWRWMLNEEINDEDMMYQEFPPTERYAFRQSGSQFFSSSRVNDEMERVKQLSYHNYKFVLRSKLELCEVMECVEKLSNLKVFAFPVAGATYAMGADPAWGSSEWADRFAISVWRCYGDGMDQVAEFCTPDCSTFQFAWVICYLGGQYGNAMLNLEINGPGQAVLAELQNLLRVAATMPDGEGTQTVEMVNSIRNYLYRKIDTWNKPSAYHTKTTTDLKELFMNFYKDCFERGTSLVSSPELLDEMVTVVREDGSLGAPGRGKDDRVIAAALAHMAWGDYLRLPLIQARVTRQSSIILDAREENRQPGVLTNYLKKIGMGQ